MKSIRCKLYVASFATKDDTIILQELDACSADSTLRLNLMIDLYSEVVAQLEPPKKTAHMKQPNASDFGRPFL